MTSLFFKKDLQREFTETDEPLDNTGEVGDEPFLFESASVYKLFGWYPFLYESPFTRRHFGPLTDMRFGGGDFPSIPPFSVPSGDVAPPEGTSGHATVPEILHDVVSTACAASEPSLDTIDLCASVMSLCAFLNMVINANYDNATTWAALSTDDKKEARGHLEETLYQPEFTACDASYTYHFTYLNCHTGSPATTPCVRLLDVVTRKINGGGEVTVVSGVGDNPCGDVGSCTASQLDGTSTLTKLGLVAKNMQTLVGSCSDCGSLAIDGDGNPT